MKQFVQDELYKTAIAQELRGLGIKVPKSRKNDVKQQPDKVASRNLFGRPLHLLHMVNVVADGLQVEIPRFLFDALNILRQHLELEGLFRKAGSITRQKTLKVWYCQSFVCILSPENKILSLQRILENDGKIESADAQDIACIVKQFLRELPEPLLVRRLHDAFIAVQEVSADEATQLRTLQIICLLLPATHLHTLRYLMLFFSELVSHSHTNKMSVSNLAVVLTPNILVSHDEPNQKEKQRSLLLQKQTGLVQLLISSASCIGIVPDVLVERVRLQTTRHHSMDDVIDDCGAGDGDHAQLAIGAGRSRKKSDKKRHSMNGVFHELRRMVRPIRHPSECAVIGGTGSPSVGAHSPATPPSGPAKRKHSDDTTQWSSSKKRAVMQASCMDVPVPIPPQPHFDSPDPVCKEDAVSLTPGDDLSHDNPQRKNGRLRIFGKTYLRRSRNSSVRTPKASKKSLAKESNSCSGPGKDNKIVGQRLSTEDTSPAIPVFSLVESPATYLAKARRQEREGIAHVPAPLSIVQLPLMDSPDLSPLTKHQTSMDHVAVKRAVVGAKEPKDLRSTHKLKKEVATDRRIMVQSKSATIVGSVRRPRNKLAIEANDDDDDDDSDIDSVSKTSPLSKSRFTRAANGSSTLRRGRPNTVRSGLPVLASANTSDQSVTPKSPKKTQDQSSISTPCPLLVDAEHKRIPKVDSGIFEPPESSMTVTTPKFDDPLDDHTGVVATGRKSSQLSISLTDIFEGLAGTGCLETPELRRRSTSWEQLMGVSGEGSGEVFLPNDEPICDVGSDVKWSRATVVLQDMRSRECDNDIENHGRPSVIRLKREKAGMVLASIKHYNDVFAGNVVEPVQEVQAREHSLRVASPVRIPPIFATPKVVGRVPRSPFVRSAPSMNSKHKSVSQKPKIKQTKNAQASTSISAAPSTGSGRSRKLGSRSPTSTMITRSLTPRSVVSTPQQQSKYTVAAVRRSPRHQSDRSALKAKAASDAYRRRAIRGQIKRRSTVL